MAKKDPGAVRLGRLGGKARAKSLTQDEISAISRTAGLVGGAARAAKLTPKRRSEIARKAALARWGKKKAD